MRTLFIDTHQSNLDIILFDDFKIISEKHLINEKHNSKYLLPMIKEVCPDKNFDEIIVVSGPGSFTGVRLGVTVAKTLAYTLNKSIKPVCYFDLMSYSTDEKMHIFGLSDNNGYFIGKYNDYKKVDEYVYLSNLQYAEYIKNNYVETDVNLDFIKILEHIKNIEGVNPHSVKPLYVKLIGVEK